jgi:hypothetical protein
LGKARDDAVWKEDSGGGRGSDRKIRFCERRVEAVKTACCGERGVAADVVISVEGLVDFLEGEVGGEVRPKI